MVLFQPKFMSPTLGQEESLQLLQLLLYLLSARYISINEWTILNLKYFFLYLRRLELLFQSGGSQTGKLIVLVTYWCCYYCVSTVLI